MTEAEKAIVNVLRSTLGSQDFYDMCAADDSPFVQVLRGDPPTSEEVEQLNLKIDKYLQGWAREILQAVIGPVLKAVEEVISR